MHTDTQTVTQHNTRLAKHFDGCYDIQAVALPRDDDVQLLEGLGGDENGVALGRQLQPLNRPNVVIEHLHVTCIGLWNNLLLENNTD